MMAYVSTFFMGLLFAVGLGVSGMTRPEKVIGFLDLTGNWDPSLAFVMGGALMVNGIAWRFIKPRGRSYFGDPFSLPRSQQVDVRLIAGATLFGMGWGVGGICPGPALTSLAFFSPGVVVFVTAMTLGMVVGNAARPQTSEARPKTGEVGVR
ncbi:DUF6691 family protein [Acanthopleuribacter pedis]|uniref:YeeE/YedE family protein n=1 Tax=Acanthopleuribacter pedis TaxID=442870 RepID=A0A8J7Q0L8_9BACT|nr:DUF6691 family protein [Acanthopleuribacter pedis]MBO1317040.1 hypothetical protein [Acanthopleuribacter pedis]